jgi:hypothetical protein
MYLDHHKTTGYLGDASKRVAMCLLYGRDYLHLEVGRHAFHLRRGRRFPLTDENIARAAVRGMARARQRA